jgi:NAD(P)-dependent dehydrogenase (short-subunit alcohol dehydrogenase family)
LLQGHVILVTGGARGVTAEVLRSIVTKDLTLILTGRKSLPNLEDALRHNQELANLQDEKEIARYFAKTKNLPFGDARRAASNVIANREMLDNISDFEVSGAKVIYKAVDVIDEKAVSNLLNDIYSTYNRLDGVVHGAGIIEDKYLSDISSESWDRVYNTKVQGLLILSKYVKSDLKFLTVFSSVAGRYGNSGQANYATANEMMNRICSQIQNLWNDKVRVSSLCWGPWSATKFGAGMITPATEEKFAKQGVHLVSAYQGQKLFHHQITIGNDVEIICGVAPWESEETKLGQYVIDKTIPTLLPLIQDTKINMLSGGKVGIDVTLNAKDAYLQDHIINGKPVFPFAMALELMSQSVAKAFGDNWVITGLQDCQLFKGIIVEEDTKDLTIVMTASHHGSADHMEVKVKMTSKNTPQPHYGATIILASNLDNTNVTIPAIAGNEVVLTAKQAYDDILFHGKVFQVIKNIELLTEQGMEAVLSASTTKMLLNSDGKWLFDPAIIDGIAQASLIYTGALKNSFVLPVSFGKITRYVTEFPEKTKMYFKVLNYTFEDILADVILTNEQGDVILTVDNMRHIVTTSYKGKTKKDLAA